MGIDSKSFAQQSGNGSVRSAFGIFTNEWIALILLHQPID